MSKEGEGILQTREQEQVNKVSDSQQSKIGVVCGREGKRKREGGEGEATSAVENTYTNYPTPRRFIHVQTSVDTNGKNTDTESYFTTFAIPGQHVKLLLWL